MKNLTQLLCCIILIVGFATPTKAQGWEIFVTDLPSVNIAYQYKLILGANNGVRVVYKQTWDDPLEMLNYDANGDFIGNEGVPAANDWTLIQSDHSGATYWETDYKIRKIDVNNQRLGI